MNCPTKMGQFIRPLLFVIHNIRIYRDTNYCLINMRCKLYVRCPIINNIHIKTNTIKSLFQSILFCFHNLFIEYAYLLSFIRIDFVLRDNSTRLFFLPYSMILYGSLSVWNIANPWLTSISSIS